MKSPTNKKPGTPSKNGHVRKSAELLRRYAVKLVPIERIKPSPENEEIYGIIGFNTDPALQSTIDSIARRGLEEPIILTADYYILSGHRRFFSVRHLGWEEIPVRFSKIRRDESTDYHRLLAEYNPQRVKSVATLLSEQFLKSETYVSDDDFHARHYEKAEVEAEFITVEGNKEIKPIGERRSEFLEAAITVINRLRNFWPLTVRQVHYKLLNSPPLTQVTANRNERWRYKNDLDSYNKLSDLLVSARYLGHVPLAALDDPTRISRAYEFLTWDSIAQFIQGETNGFLTGYQRHRLEGQRNHVELLIEKNTLINIVEPVANKFMLPLSVNRGYGNPSLWHKMETRWHKSGAERFILLTISDHDPEGFDLIDDATRSLRDLHDVSLEVVRVGLTMEQIETQEALPAFAKETSSRFKQYVGRTGLKECWEVEAIDPEFLQNQVHDAVLSVLDVEQLNAVQQRQAVEQAQVAAIRRRLGLAMQRLIAEEGI
jgi:ParB/Sulfiredoxin domain